MKVREERDDLVLRVRILMVVMAALLALIAGSFWFVQVVQGDYYRQLAENNRLRKLPIKARRGLIHDRHGQVLAENVPSYNLHLNLVQSASAERSLTFASAVLGRPARDVRAQVGQSRPLSPFTPVELARNLTLAQVARFGVQGLEHPEFEIDVQHVRLYRHGAHTAHLLGYLGEVSDRDLAEEASPYQAGDMVGKAGVERIYDRGLRGRDGERVVVVDSRGKVLEEVGRVPARPGRDCHLAIDLELQQLASHLLADKVGAIVALDPADGAVRALVSSPSFDPNRFARDLTPDEWRGLLEAPHHPLQNRAIQNTYAPGSVFKIVVAIVALEEGSISP